MRDANRFHLYTLAAGLLAGVAVSVIYSRLARGGERVRKPKEPEPETLPSGLVKFSPDQEGGDVPENAPTGCPGVQSDTAGNSSACAGCPNKTLCASGAGSASGQKETEAIATKLAEIKRKILVLSGKGGVGKSTLSTQIAWDLASRGHSVGLLDIDICGPSIPRMTGTQNAEVRAFGEGWLPVCVSDNLCVMSIGYLLPAEDGAVIWRGPKKNGLIRQFLTDVYWGALDYLIVDTPPGTSDEHLSIVTYLQEAGVDGAIVVTTPQEVSLQDVRKEINFCKQTNIPVLGVVENMAGSVFASLDPEAAKRTCVKMDVPYAGCVDLDPSLLQACEHGVSVDASTGASRQIRAALESCLSQLKN